MRCIDAQRGLTRRSLDRCYSWALFFSSILLSSGAWAEEDSSGKLISFSNEIAPVLQKHCVPCHGPKLAESNYRVDSYRALQAEMTSGQRAILPDLPEMSELFQRLVHEDSDLRMPAEADALDSTEIDLIKEWIQQGAVFDGHSPDQILISLMPGVRHPAPPTKYPAPLPISAIAFDTESNEIFVSGYHEITTWSLTGDLIRRFSNQGQRTYSIDIDPSREQLLSSGGTPGVFGEVRVFDLESGRVLATLARADEVILDAQYSPDGTQVAVAMPDGSVKVYDTKTNLEQLTLLGHSDQVTSLTWHPDGQRLATASRDKAAKVFDVKTGKSISTFAGHTACVNSIAFLDGDEVISVSDDGKASVWSANDGRRRREAISGKYPWLDVARLEKVYVVAGADRVIIFEVGTNRKISELASHGDWMTVVAREGSNNTKVIGLHTGEVITQNAENEVTRFSVQP